MQIHAYLLRLHHAGDWKVRPAARHLSWSSTALAVPSFSPGRIRPC